MHIAILTFEGFNELDSLLAFIMLNRVQRADWRVSITSPVARIRSRNGLLIEAQAPISVAREADAVLIGSGVQTLQMVKDAALMAELRLDPSRQLVGAQCSGTLILAKLGLLDGVAACTDLISKPWVEEAGIEVLDTPFFARGNVATAGGCFASPYLASWMIARLAGYEAARTALHYVAPVGEKEQYISHVLQRIAP